MQLQKQVKVYLQPIFKRLQESGASFNFGAISMGFAGGNQLTVHQPDGSDVMESSYTDSDAQIALVEGAILHVAFRDGKFRFVKVIPSGNADIPNTAFKPLSLDVSAMENCLMTGKVVVGGDVFVFQDKVKAQKTIRGLFPR